jgi:hypothetical protein
VFFDIEQAACAVRNAAELRALLDSASADQGRAARMIPLT